LRDHAQAKNVKPKKRWPKEERLAITEDPASPSLKKL
jgi:hypothetical protein